jgi:hypothetical protein
VIPIVIRLLPIKKPEPNHNFRKKGILKLSQFIEPLV